MKYFNKFRRKIACLFIRKFRSLDLEEAVISFSFDDAPESAFRNGRSLLNKFGYQGTYFISLSIAEKTNPEGPYFNTDQLAEVVAEGGELGCHTYSHLHLYQSDRESLKADLKKNQDRINDILPGYHFRNFAYPWGEQSISTKKVIREQFISARSVNGGLNASDADLNNLWANQLCDNLPLNQVYALVDEAIRTKGWLIFYTHDVQEYPSQWGCSPQYFENVLAYCISRKVKVQTIGKAVEKFDEK
jgi:peptidoglycan/xylan/chitin deacetylase (PgdA/CDA1 family)